MSTDLNVSKIKSLINKKGKAITVMIGNQKGGVGKTANTTLIAYTMAKLGINTLVADMDPQSNATKILTHTKSQKSDQIYTIDKTIMRGVQEHDLTDLPINVMPNLDLLPSNTDFDNFPRYVYKTTNNQYDEDHILAPLFEPLKEKYEIILIDTPPHNSEIDKNAPVFCDYVLISLQTEEDSLVGANEFIKALVKIKKRYNLPVEIVGILPMMRDKKGSVDKKVLAESYATFGEENVFNTIISRMQRIKRFPFNGITNNDKFDRNVLDMYSKVTNELINRIIELEE